MTPIEKALFIDETVHWICSFDLTPEAMEISLHPCDRPELVCHAKFIKPKIVSIDRSYADEDDGGLPWDILGFESQPLRGDLWEFCLHTDPIEYVFESAWPEIQKPMKAGTSTSVRQPTIGALEVMYVVCPTCHSVDRSPVIRSVGNSARIAINAITFLLVGLTPLSLRRKCRNCQAFFKRRFRVKEKTCWKCGYPRKGLPEPRCPECGTWFDTDDRTGC